MKKILLLIALLPLLAIGQGIPQTFKYKDGTSLGRWLVKDIPNNIIACCGTNQGQFLLFYPPAYGRGKKCGTIIWQGGKGENTSLDISEVYKNSLPYMVQNGLTPYSLKPNGDTVWYVVAAIHNNFQSSYRTKLKTIIPYILDTLVKQLDPDYVMGSGLSEGGAGTWGIFMLDSIMSQRVKFCVSLANGGYDDSFTALQGNLLAAYQHGVYFLPYIGTQDPGWLPYQQYDAYLKANAKGKYFLRAITNGTHSANVWDLPWKSRGFWDSIGAFGYKAPAAPTRPVVAKILQDSTEIHYPNTRIYLYDSSYSNGGKKLNSYFTMGSYPTTYVGPVLTPLASGGAILSGLVAGVYQVKLYAFDSATNYVDTAFAYVKVNGPPACPACPVCPPPRKVVSLQIPLFNAWITVPVDAAKIGYDDGNP